MVVVNAFFDWVADPSVQTHRWLLLLCAIALALGAVALRDLRRRDAVSLVDAAGLSILALGVTLAVTQFLGVVVGSDDGGGAAGPAGWELVLLVSGFGLIAYGAIDRERVPAFIGVLVLGVFAIEAGIDSEASLLWWPLLLLIAALGLLALGLRPGQTLPPEPMVPPAPTSTPPTEPMPPARP